MEHSSPFLSKEPGTALCFSFAFISLFSRWACTVFMQVDFHIRTPEIILMYELWFVLYKAEVRSRIIFILVRLCEKQIDSIPAPTFSHYSILYVRS
jgi:hypothetical protein